MFNHHKPLSIRNIVIITLLGGMLMGGITGGVVGLYTAASISGNAVNANMIARAPHTVKPAAPNAPSPTPVSEDQSLSAMVKKVTPAVVSIIISKEVSVAQPNDFFNLGPFSFDMGNGNSDGNTNAPTQKQDVGGGSGFIISSDGLIVTNRHVVDDTSATYTVVLSDGSKHDAKVLARDTAIEQASSKTVWTHTGIVGMVA